MTILLIFVAGLFLGTLLNVIIIRLPREKRLLGWLHCTRTGETLRWWQVLPLAGWLIQRGRASDGQRLHWIYPLVELLMGLVLVRLSMLYGLTPPFFYLAFVCMVLIVTGAIDWLYRYIYTFVILGAALLALILAPLVGLQLADVLLGTLVAGGAFMLLFVLAKAMFPGKAVPFGLGDVYLGMFIGAAVGLNHLMAALFYGVLMAGLVALFIVIGRRIRRSANLPEYISYGSYLCLGVVLYVAGGGL
jgi:leader peptidase (prepilin peptidase)/N-methyltransferase